MSRGIRAAREEIEAEIQALYDELSELQEGCKHKNATKKYRGSSGNYDPTNDCYWIEYKCPDCGKQWSVDQ